MITKIGVEEQVRLWDGCQSYWKLNETSGTNASDSISALNGTITTGAFDSSGKNGYCYKRTSKVGAGISVGNVHAFEYNQSFSVNLWINFDELNATNLFFSKEHVSTYYGYGIFKHSNNQIYAEIRGSGIMQVFNSGTTISQTGTWYMVTLTYNGNGSNTGMKVYVNASFTRGSSSGTLSSTCVSTQALTIGSYAADLNNGHLGRIDDVAIWNRELSQKDITELYNSGNGKFYGTNSKASFWYGLKHYYNMNETAGTLFSDTKGTINLTKNGGTIETGKYGNGVAFSGITQYLASSNLSTTDLLNFERTQPVSFSLWFKRGNAIVEDKAFFSKGYNNGSAGYLLYMYQDGRIYFNLYGTSSSNRLVKLSTNKIPNDYNWYHIVVTYAGTSNSSGVKIYINATDAGSDATYDTLNTTTKVSYPFYIGVNCQASPFTKSCNGSIDELAVWNRVLSATEITALYRNGVGLYY